MILTDQEDRQKGIAKPREMERKDDPLLRRNTGLRRHKDEFERWGSWED